MKIVKLDEMLENGYLNELQSKIGFDNVDDINAKPSAETEGFTRAKIPDLAKSDNDDVMNNFIIADKPNLYKQNGESVSKKQSIEKNYIKLGREGNAEYLISRHPFAFLLLSLIAIRAERKNNPITGLKAGEALIGDYEAIGATRQQYRTALDVLKRHHVITIVETCRTRKKSATGITTVGTKVRLLDSSIYDINPEDINHRNGHRPTTDQPPTNHEQEGKEDKELIDLIDQKEEKIFSEEKKQETLIEDKKIDMNNFNEKKMKIDEDEIYRAMLKYPTEIVKEAILRARPKVERCEISNVIRYIETTCVNMINEKNKKEKFQKKTKPKPIGSEPPKENKPLVKWPGL